MATWTETEIQILTEYATTKTSTEIGIMVNKSAAAVRNKAKRLKIRMRKIGENHQDSKLSNLQVAMILTLCEAGFTSPEIHKGAFHHVSLSTIKDIKLMRTHRGNYE